MCPVIISAAGLTRKRTVHATSTGLNKRFMGSDASAASNQFSPPFATIKAVSFSVTVHPMFTELTLMPCGASSVALHWVTTFNAAFEAEYAVMNGAPPLAAIELTLTIEPRVLVSIMILATACVKKNGPLVLVSNCLLNISTEVFMRLPRSVVPPALTRPSTRPFNAVAACSMDDCSDATLVTSVSTKVTTHLSIPSSLAAASPLLRVRDMRTNRAAPQSRSCRAISRPRP
mmetsp:Transcript_39821/g.78752  ORF Transcript_39821/g.78752 Transcript_39821/m.78752 type:complete len:231 (-) Transcript_39821:157-849(-)